MAVLLAGAHSLRAQVVAQAWATQAKRVKTRGPLTEGENAVFVPLSDEPNPRTIPYVTTLLVVLNVGLWLLVCWPMTGESLHYDTPGMPEYLRVLQQQTGVDRVALFQQTSAYELFCFTYGFRPSQPSVVALFTSLFLHAGWLHLLGNMLFLWIFGNNVEARLGSWAYLATYLGCGVVATGCYALLRAGSVLPLIGASGAISGVLGCYLVWFPRNRVRVLVTLLIFWQRITLPAWLVLGIYLLVDNLVPLVLGGLGSAVGHGPGAAGVAHGAHVGGFFAGAAVALARSYGLGTGGGSSSDRAPAGVAGAAAAIGRQLRAGDYERAWLAFLRLPPPPARHLPVPEVFLLVDWHTEQGNYPQAMALLADVASAHAAAPEVVASARLRQGLVTWRGLNDARLAGEYLRQALAQSGGQGAVAAAARLALDQLAQAG